MSKPDKTEKVDLEPDAWQRFERAVSVVAKSPPQPKIKRRPGKPSPRKVKSEPAKSPRARKGKQRR